jgi:L-ascorbate metabolism protein UlaG (beta-lactamase superfamily)
MNPEQAWSIFNLINGHKLLPIHWRTFILSPVPIDEPIERLRKAAGAEQSKIICDTPGKTAVLKLTGRSVWNY